MGEIKNSKIISERINAIIKEVKILKNHDIDLEGEYYKFIDVPNVNAN